MKAKKALKTVLIVLPILAALLVGGFAALYYNGLSGISKVSEPSKEQIKIACVGDSITYGHGIANWPENNYPTVLQKRLGEDFHVNNYGVSGYAVNSDADKPYVSLSQYENSLEYDAHIVVFMMGSNDSKPYNWQGAEVFRKNLDSLLDSYGDSHIILCTPASAFFLYGQTEGETSFNIQPLVVDEIAQIVRDTAKDRDCIMIDIHALTAQHPEWFAADGVHPNSDGAAAIAKAICRVITGHD